MDISQFLNRVNQYILNPIIFLAFAVASLVLIFGIFQFIASETAEGKREEGKKKIIYGLIGMFVMFAAYGLVYLILGTFGIDAPEYIQGR